MPRQALIVGLGLIGGSIALALRDRGWDVRYTDEARKDAPFEFVETYDDASIIVVATPVAAAITKLAEIPPRSGAITSVCSVLGPLRDAAGARRFIAGHPMAGSHESGFGAARANLFEGKPWFVDGEDAEVDQLVRDCGATLERVDADTHDKAVAVTSHLPQVLSSALAAYLGEHPELLRFAGSGLETFLRLAASDASVWSSVITSNAENIKPHADAVARLVAEMLASDDPTATLKQAQDFWRRL